MVEQGVNGWLYSQNSVNDLKELFLKILADPVPYLYLPFDNHKTRLPVAEAEDVKKLYNLLMKNS